MMPNDSGKKYTESYTSMGAKPKPTCDVLSQCCENEME